MLESFLHGDASFVTLTYKDEDLPYDTEYKPTLCKRDVQLWLKRVRKRFGSGVRYYLVGEYGEKTRRPHYHCILYGVSPFALDPLWMHFDGKSGHGRRSLLSDLWGHGLVHVGECTRESIQYVAGYVLKKFVRKTDVAIREFALMSRRPGIGYGAVEYLLAACKIVAEPPRAVRIERKMWPLGRYIAGKLADAVGYTGGPDAFLRDIYSKHNEYLKSGSSVDFTDWLIGIDDQRFKQLDARSNRLRLRDFDL